MVREYKKKTEGSRQNLSTSQAMVEAYNSVLSKQMALNGSAKYYGINKKSLLQRVSIEIPVNTHVGRQTAIASLHEAELADYIKVMADWGYAAMA
ncbi:hypothetical protein ElyMa_002346500 [Elysia marginata]|uniref:HTH psq-type domain-containing protein n=1 Tax=Elysia marginata TaxID=1093978 RepID=A0AAV4G9B0_9GAST|nr:hypothetical protein ElyMa_002346500 [Elysia marginata]